MIFKPGAGLYSSELERKEGENVLHINFIGADYVPLISSYSKVMERVVSLLAENPSVSRVLCVQQRNYSYNSKQTLFLAEIARLFNFLTKQENILSPERLNLLGNPEEIHAELSAFLTLLREDPAGCYLMLQKKAGALRKELDSNPNKREAIGNHTRFLEKFLDLLGSTKLIKQMSLELTSAVIGDRKIYDEVFRPDVLPNFTFTRLVAQLPENAELLDQYEIGEGEEKFSVTILQKTGEAKPIYHILPPEYTLNEDHHLLLTLARQVLSEHRPKSEEFIDAERTRQVFFNVSRDLLTELSKSKGIPLSYRELVKLSNILVRHTIGFGLLEILLADEKLQDIVLNAPIAQNPVFVRHSKFEECVTNVFPSYEDADSWATKLRLQSGRPLDEANPVLDTDLSFGSVRARVAAVKEPLSPRGLAYALRRHRDSPWTLPLFIQNKMINSFAAGLLSFMIDGSRTLLVAGTRSSGKTSLLGSLLLEIMPKFRILVVEDTPELPIEALRKIGYDILGMKVRSALTSGTTEVAASEGIRTSLRLGDSALILGEVRSEEAKALYEAMRIGALANVVAGTIHGDSPYGVFDRVTNDLGVPATSFKATDLIIIANPIKTPDGLHSVRRVLQITEVRKHWQKDPLAEQGFVDLMRYNVEKDELEPTDALINGDSEIIKSIAGRVKGWAGNWDAVYDNIILRGKMKQEIVDVAQKLNKPMLLEAEFNALSNAMFHKFSEDAREEKGMPLEEFVFPKWQSWLMDEAKKL